MTTGFHFEPLSHTYTFDGEVVPSITQVLKHSAGAGLYYGNGCPEALADFGKDRGTKVHQACQYLVEGVLDLDTLDPVLVPFVGAWDKWLKESGFQPVFVEEPEIRLSPVRYAGTPDYIGKLEGVWAVVNLKSGTSSIPRWVGLQTAAEGHLRSDAVIPRRIGLQLKPDGSFKMREFPQDEFLGDLDCFVAALKIYEWKEGIAVKRGLREGALRAEYESYCSAKGEKP